MLSVKIRLQIGLQATLLSWLALSIPVLAQTQPDGLPRLPTNLPTDPAESAPAESAPAESAPAESEVIQNGSATASVVELTLPDLLNIVIQGNRDIKNDVLERVVQRQTLNEAESQFNPQITPSLSIQAERNGGFAQTSSILTPDGNERSDNNLDNLDSSASSSANSLGGSDTTLTQNLQVSSTLRTPLGTGITLSVNPISESSRLNLTIEQPLLRGSGQAVNRAPVQQARIAESNNVLALRQTVIETVTKSINQYTTLAERQEAVVIQLQALERRRQQFERVNALVEAGRRARIDLIDSERSIAEAELALQAAQNNLSQSNTDLLNLVGADTAFQFVAPENAIAQLFEAAASRMNQLQLDQMIELAYQIRPDYQQAQASLESGDLDLLLAEDNQRWTLNWQSSASLGNAPSQVATGLALSRTLGDESLDTAVARSQTSILQQQNKLAQLSETIRNEITDQLRNVNSGLAQVALAQRATEAAQLQLQVTQEKFRLGRENTTLFEITDQEEALVTAQNQELQARIGFLNSMADLEQAVGITLDTWQASVDFSSVLAEESDLTEENAPASTESVDAE
jgi:outer membrane protein